MPAYRLYLDNANAEQKLYDMLDSIVIEQAVDLVTEATIDLEMCADDKGNWTGTGEAYATAFKRVRVEIKNGDGGWVPLIDGPIVARNAKMSSEPGQSMLTLTVYDDSIYLNRVASVRPFEGMSDADVVKKLLGTVTQIDQSTLSIDTIPATTSDRTQQRMQRGTEMDLLREITAPYELHVYVRPGKKVGDKSLGFVKKLDATKRVSLPALVLLGPDRNIDTFHVRDDVATASRGAAAQLDIGDLSVRSTETSWRDVDLLGDRTAVDDAANVGLELLRPVFAAFAAVPDAAKQLQQGASYTVTATGTTRLACYDGVLQPFEAVNVRGADARLSTTFVIKEVTHTLGRSEYRQDFTLITNAVAKSDRNGTPIPFEVAL